MVGTVLALMIADIKRVSQVFQGFKTACTLEIFGFLGALLKALIPQTKNLFSVLLYLIFSFRSYYP